MKHLVLTSVAAFSIVASAAVSFAQAPGGTQTPAGGAMQGSGAGGGAVKGSDTAAPGPKSESAPSTSQPSKGAEPSSPASKSGAATQDKSGGTMQDKGKSAGDTKADPSTKSSTSGNQPAATSKDAKSPATETKAGTDTKTDTKNGSDSKTNADGANTAAAPPAEKRTQITSAFKQEKVTEVTNVNFNISVGTTVPSTVSFRPLPSRVIEIYPQWRGYDFILVRGRYVILRPQTHEIVYIIEN